MLSRESTRIASRSLANTLDQLFRKDMYERYQFTIANCEPIRDRTFLDVGCGNGLYSSELARKGARKVVGIDIAEVMIGLCKKPSEQELSTIVARFIQTDLLDYKAEAKFDVSFGIGLFDYISDPLAGAEADARVSAATKRSWHFHGCGRGARPFAK